MKALIGLALLLASSTASAYWYAEASSNSSYGWATSNNQRQAELVALQNCRFHGLAWGDFCYITASYWVN